MTQVCATIDVAERDRESLATGGHTDRHGNCPGAEIAILPLEGTAGRTVIGASYRAPIDSFVFGGNRAASRTAPQDCYGRACGRGGLIDRFGQRNDRRISRSQRMVLRDARVGGDT